MNCECSSLSVYRTNTIMGTSVALNNPLCQQPTLLKLSSLFFLLNGDLDLKCYSSIFCLAKFLPKMTCFSTPLPCSTHFARALSKHSLKLLELLPSCHTLLDILLSLPLAKGVSSSTQCKAVSILLSHFFTLLKRGSTFLMESECSDNCNRHGW